VAKLELDAIVLASDPLSRVRIAGLSARERAVRVAKRVGAERVLVVDGDTDIRAWREGRSCALLVIEANQLVHTPLVAPLIEAMPAHGYAMAVDDLTYAGAFVAAPDVADEAITKLAPGVDAVKVQAGAIAHAPIATPEQRKAAHKLLYKILIKPQDNAITRYLYRPVSFPLTRMLVWTPITPNQISYLVAVMVAIGCWFTAHQSMTSVLIGTIIVLAASYVDCCDGEVARVKLLSSRFGAWVDTIVDELSSIGYMAAIGYHCHLYFGPNYLGDLSFDPWLAGIVVGVITYAITIYSVYYNIIVAVGSANSQDYVGRFEVVPGSQPNTVRLAPAAAKAIATKKPLPPWLEFIATYLPYIVRRDFIAWGSVALVAAHLTHVAFVLFVAGGVVSSVIVGIDHLKLRSLRRSATRRGLVFEAP
jgi:hypothetical protein